MLYRKNDGAQTEQNQPSASVATSQEDAAGSSENKDTNISSNDNENNESLTFEDGTPIPVDESGGNDTQHTTTESDADIEKNKVDDMKVVDNIVEKKTRNDYWCKKWKKLL